MPTVEPRKVRSRVQLPPDRVETFHLTSVVAQRARDWFGTDGIAAVRDGERSVRIAHPERQDRLLKIKGAGLNGGGIRFGTAHASRLKAPVFDFDGRMMEDAASGYDNAWLGGATFQQVVIEHRVTASLSALGVPVVPCLGYGHVGRTRTDPDSRCSNGSRACALSIANRPASRAIA